MQNIVGHKELFRTYCFLGFEIVLGKRKTQKIWEGSGKSTGESGTD
jgi:hypothetical protein